MRSAALAIAIAACGGARAPAPSPSPSNVGPPAGSFACGGRSARMQFSTTAGTWSHHAVRLACDGDHPIVEVSGLRNDEDAERTASAPIDAAAFERAWARIDASGWGSLEGGADCTSTAVDETTQTVFAITGAGAKTELVCRSFPGSLAGGYDAIASALLDAADAAGLDATSASRK